MRSYWVKVDANPVMDGLIRRGELGHMETDVHRGKTEAEIGVIQ